MKTILLTLTYLVGAGELILAIYFWVTNSKSEIRRVMALFAFFMGMWVISSAASAYTNETPFLWFALSLVYVFGVLMNVSLLHFAIIFPFPTLRFDKMHKFLLYIPALVFSAIALFTRTIAKGIDITPNTQGTVISGPVHIIYNVYLLINFLLILGLFLYKSRKGDRYAKNRVIIVFFSILLGGIFAIWADVILMFFPHFMRMNFLYGNIGTAIWLGITTYIVSKK